MYITIYLGLADQDQLKNQLQEANSKMTNINSQLEKVKVLVKT